MKQVSNGPDEGACIFGAGVLLKHLNALEEETEGIRTGSKDIEFIHRARVATRRLRATLPLFIECLPNKKSKAWLKQIKKLTSALGHARDLDVQLEKVQATSQTLTDAPLKPGFNRLELRLSQERTKLQVPLQKNIDRLVESHLIEDMRATLTMLNERAADVYLYTPALYQQSFHAIHDRLEDFLSYEEYVTQPERASELHQMRIAAKWLRYTLETYAPLYPNQLKSYLQGIKKIQEMLGEIHDCDVWSEFLPRFLSEERQRTLEYFGTERNFRRIVPGILYFEQERQQARQQHYEEFLQYWQKTQESALWSELNRTIQMPFPQPELNDLPFFSPPEETNS